MKEETFIVITKHTSEQQLQNHYEYIQKISSGLGSFSKQNFTGLTFSQHTQNSRERPFPLVSTGEPSRPFRGKSQTTSRVPGLAPSEICLFLWIFLRRILRREPSCIFFFLIRGCKSKHYYLLFLSQQIFHFH